MYNQNLIDEMGEQYFDAIVSGNWDYEFDLNKKTFKDILKYNSFQHYLVKCCVTGKYRDKIGKFLQQFYAEDFYNNQYFFCDSPLLNFDNLDIIFGDKPIKGKIKKHFDEYYAEDAVKQIYRKSKTSELSSDEKNRLYSFLITKITNPKYEKVLEKVIIDIINKYKYVSEMNEMEFKFYSQYISNYALKGKNVSSVVLIGSVEKNHKGVACLNTIRINKDSGDSIYAAAKTICHESRHLVQRYEAKNKITTSAFEAAQRALFSEYLDEGDYDSYHKNYVHSSIEIDAEKHGHSDAGVFFYMLGRKDLNDKIREHRVQKLDKRNFYEFFEHSDGSLSSIDKAIVEHMDSILKAHPEELDNYPVLECFYNKNGTRKSFADIMYQRLNPGLDVRSVFNPYINYGIVRNGLNSLNLDGESNEVNNSLFNVLASIYRDNVAEIKDYFDDTEVEQYDPIAKETFIPPVIEATGHKIKIIKKILEFINKNYDRIVDMLDDKEIQSSYLFEFVYWLRDFNIDSVKNPYLKDDERFKSMMNDIMLLTNENIMKFNKQRIIQRLNKLSDEELNTMVNGMTLSEYLLNVILPKMDGHQYVEINGKKMTIGDVIRSHTQLNNGVNINRKIG